jgi:hypothetical protein
MTALRLAAASAGKVVTMPFLYHARPARMRGDTLYPLNALRARHPDLYEDERRKYVGRELLLELRIPVLDVLWNAALHLTPIHPSRLAAVWRAAGLSSPAWQREFFEIPVGHIDAKRAVWFASGALPFEDVTPFHPSRYRELTEAPAAHREYLRRCVGEGRSPRPFAYVPHVLVAAPVDVAGLALVRAE